MLQYRYDGNLFIGSKNKNRNKLQLEILTFVRNLKGDVMGIRKWYVEYFANNVLLTEFFRYESDARKFCSQVGGYVDYDHYRVIAEIEGVSA